MTRESMTFYAEWLTAVKSLPTAMQADVLLAILEYGLNGVDTCSEGSIESAILAFIKPQIDINNQRFENGKKGAEFGKLGGRPRKTPKKPQENPEETPRKPQNNPIGFSTPLSPSSLSPATPITTPPISPSSTTTTENAHTREEWEVDYSENDPYGTSDPKEKSSAKKESSLSSGTWVASEDLEGVLLNDERWFTNVSANKGIPPDVLKRLIGEFTTQVLLTEEGKEISDAKRHFMNWLRKRPKENEQQARQQTRVGAPPEPNFRGVAEAVARGLAAAAARKAQG